MAPLELPKLNGHYKKLIFVFSILLGLACSLAKEVVAQEVILSEGKKIPINISSSVEIYRDETAKLTLEQVKTKQFEKSLKNHFLFPYTDDVFWVRFKLKNSNNPQKEWKLVWTNPLVEQFDFYLSDTTGQNFSHTLQKICYCNILWCRAK